MLLFGRWIIEEKNVCIHVADDDPGAYRVDNNRDRLTRNGK